MCRSLLGHGVNHVNQDLLKKSYALVQGANFLNSDFST